MVTVGWRPLCGINVYWLPTLSACTHSHTLTGCFHMDTLKRIRVQLHMEVQLLLALLNGDANKLTTDRCTTRLHTHAHTCTHTRTDSTCTLALLASCICFYLVVCLLEMLRGDMNFLSSSSCLHVWLVCLSPCVCSSVSERLVLGLSECDEKQCQRVKMMLKKNQDREGWWETDGRKRGHISKLFSHWWRAVGGWEYKKQLVVEHADALCNSYSVLCNLFG